MTIGTGTKYRADQIRRLREHRSPVNMVVARYHVQGREVVSNYEPGFDVLVFRLGNNESMLFSGFRNNVAARDFMKDLQTRIDAQILGHAQYLDRQFKYESHSNLVGVMRTA